MSDRSPYRRIAVIVGVTVALAVVATGVVWILRSDGPAPTLDPSSPEGVVGAVLQLRADHVTDPDAYAPYFLSPDVAALLAEDSSANTTAAPTPAWETPYVGSLETTSAEVIVVWGDRSDFEGWPEAHAFIMTITGDRWVIVDAVELAPDEIPALPEER